MFPLRSAFVKFRSCNFLRNYSTIKLVNAEINEKTGIATVTLQHRPVNCLSLECSSALAETITELEKSKVRGAILVSAVKNVFCAGLDINELYQPKDERFHHFWSAFQQVWLKIYGSSFPIVAAINGHAPAGGCVIAISAEYRVMVKNYNIGLNETRVSIVPPIWVMHSMVNTVGMRQAELALTTGRLFTTEEAYNLGLIDEMAEDTEDALQKAEKFLQRFDKVNMTARNLTKQILRREEIKRLNENLGNDLEEFKGCITKEETQKWFATYLAALKKRKS